MYEPLKVFTIAGLLTFSGGFLIALRFLYLYLNNPGQGNVQSLILSAVLMIVGFQVILIGLMADVISANRKLTEELLYRTRSLELNLSRETKSVDSSAPERLLGRGTVVGGPGLAASTARMTNQLALGRYAAVLFVTSVLCYGSTLAGASPAQTRSRPSNSPGISSRAGSVALTTNPSGSERNRGVDGRYYAKQGIAHAVYSIPFYLVGRLAERVVGARLNQPDMIPKAAVALGSIVAEEAHLGFASLRLLIGRKHMKYLQRVRNAMTARSAILLAVALVGTGLGAAAYRRRKT